MDGWRASQTTDGPFGWGWDGGTGKGRARARARALGLWVCLSPTQQVPENRQPFLRMHVGGVHGWCTCPCTHQDAYALSGIGPKGKGARCAAQRKHTTWLKGHTEASRPHCARLRPSTLAGHHRSQASFHILVDDRPHHVSQYVRQRQHRL